MSKNKLLDQVKEFVNSLWGSANSESDKIKTLNHIQKNVGKHDITDDKVSSTMSIEEIDAMLDEFRKDWFSRLDKKITDALPFNVGKCIFFLYGYEYAKLRPDLQKYCLDFNGTLLNIELTDMSAIRTVYPTIKDLHENNEYTDLYRNLNSKADEIVKSSIEDTGFDIDFISYMLGVSKYAESVYETYKQLSNEEVLQIKNEELKSLIISRRPEIIEQCLEKVHTHVCDKDEKYKDGILEHENTGVYTLFKTKGLRETLYYVRAYDYSTDRTFLLGVQPLFKRADDAIASLLRIPKRIPRDEIVAINRQGEKFSLYLTPKGESISKKLKPEDFTENNTYYLSGKEYFSMMRYEY